MNILALDFDGVVADSQYEALYTSFHAYINLTKKTRLFGGEEFACKDMRIIKKKYKKDVKEYVRLRPYVIKATDYYVILRAMDGHLKVKGSSDFKKLVKKYEIESREFNSEFYRLRNKFQTRMLVDWCKLTLPYKKIVNHCKKIKNLMVIFVTNNESLTLIETLNEFGINVKKDRIFDWKFGTNKKEKIKAVAIKYKIPLNDIYFVDDQIESLIKVKEIGVNCYLALWGYNNKEQRELAKKEGIILLTEKGFLKEFK